MSLQLRSIGSDNMNETTIDGRVLDKDTFIIDPGRQLDNDNAHEMVQAVSKAQAGGYRYIIIDMSNLAFISSSGVGSILGSVEVSREAGGDIILCNVSDTVRNILNVLDLLDYLTVASDTNDALSSCCQ